MTVKRTYRCEEAAQIIGVNGEIILQFIKHEWLMIHEPQSLQMDDEDLARARLIYELQHDMGVNDEAVPIILHLIDQIHHFQSKMKTELVSLEASPKKYGEKI